MDSFFNYYFLLISSRPVGRCFLSQEPSPDDPGSTVCCLGPHSFGGALCLEGGSESAEENAF